MLNQTKLTPGDQVVLVAAWQSLKTPPKIDYTQLANTMRYKNAATANAVWYALKKKLQLDSTLVVDKEKAGRKKRGFAEVKEEGDEDVKPKTTEKASKVRKLKGVFVKKEEQVDNDLFGECLDCGVSKPDLNLDVSDFEYEDGEVSVDVETERLRAQFRSEHADLYPEQMAPDGVDDTMTSGCGKGELEAEVKFEDVQFEVHKAELGDWDSEAEAMGVEWILHGAAEFLREAGATGSGATES